jgi:hypothetical protein
MFGYNIYVTIAVLGPLVALAGGALILLLGGRRQ